MPVKSYPDFFNDVFGPVMQPGSSSHTAAPCRLARLAHDLLGEPPRQIRVLLDKDGSFAGTFGMMAEDQAMLMGAMGMLPDDARLFEAERIARDVGVEWLFEFTEMRESRHINAMKFVLTGKSGRAVTLVGDSTGGGMIETQVINGYPLRLRGDSYVLLIEDSGRELTAEMVTRLAHRLSALVEVGTSERVDPGRLHFFRTADPPDLEEVRTLLPGYPVSLLRPVLPVITRPERKPQLFDTMTRWREIAEERGLRLWEVAVQYEMDFSGWSREQTIATMRQIETKMHRQTHAVYEEDVAVPVSPFKPHMAAEWERHRRSARRLTDDLVANTIKWAYGAGAGIPGVETVAGPMGSGGGYVHAALWAVKEARGFDEDDLLRGLFVAAAVGVIAFSRTRPTGEVIGCSGECGICGAMAAAAIAEMAGGTPEQVECAASLHLQAFMGLPCDPIQGGMGQPCRSRIIAATCTASVFADLALAGRRGVLPLHEVIDAVDAVGRQLPPELLCTARGGCSVAPTALQRGTAFRDWHEQNRRDGTPCPPGNLI